MTVVLLGKRPQRARLFQQADPVPPNPVNSVSRKGQERAGTALIPTDPARTQLAAGHGHVVVGAGDALTITGYHLHPQ